MKKNKNTGHKSETASLITQQMSLPELFRAIPIKVPQTVITIMIIILVSLPLVTRLYVGLKNQILKHFAFVDVMVTIGGLGWFVGLFMLIWFKCNKDKNISQNAQGKSIISKIFDNGLCIFLGCMLAWSGISTIMSPDFQTSLFGLSRMEGFVAYLAYAGIFIMMICMHDRKKMKIIMEVFVACASIVALICLINNQSIMNFMDMYIMQAGFLNSNHYGYYTGMGIMAAILLFVISKPMENKKLQVLRDIVLIAQIVLICNALIQSKTLGVLLAVLLAVITLLIFTVLVDDKSLGRVIAATLCLIIACGISSIGTWNFREEAYQMFQDINVLFENKAFVASREETSESSASSESSAASTSEAGVQVGEDGRIERDPIGNAAIDNIGSGRGIQWSLAYQFMKERPLFGYGADNLAPRYQAYNVNNDRPHCEILQFAASLGIPAAIFYLLALLSHLIMFIKKIKKIDMMVLCTFCIVLEYLISSMVGNTMYYTTPFFFMFLGMSRALIKDTE